MTRQEFAELLGLPPDATSGDLVRARTARIGELQAELAQDGLSKPIKIKLTLELAELESGSTHQLVGQLEVLARAESFVADINAELAKPKEQWTRGVIELLCKKLEALLPTVPDESSRLAFEKCLVGVREKIAVATRPPPSTLPPTVRSIDKGPKPVAPAVAPPRAAVGKKPATGSQLEMIPKTAEGTLHRASPPIHLVARPRFVLGRQRTKVDFVSWFLPETPANQQKTDTISRVNTTLLLKGTQIWVHDGEALEGGAKKPSVSTIIDGVALTTEPRQLNFTKERDIRLGQAGYQLKALHLPPAYPAGPPGAMAASTDTASAQATVVLPQRPQGCLRFQSVSCKEVVVEAVWLFSEASLGSGPNCAVVLAAAGLPPVALRVFCWQGGFWLEVPRELTGLPAELDGQPLQPGTACALQTAHQLRLGSLQYELKVVP